MKRNHGKHAEGGQGSPPVSRMAKRQGVGELLSPAREGGVRRLLFILLAIGIVACVYANALDGPFLFDDVLLIKTNPLIRQPSAGLAYFRTDIFSHSLDAAPRTRSYRPLQMVSYAADLRLWGEAPRGFHVTNVIIHLINTILVFLLMQDLFKTRFVSSCTAFLFGVHPVNTQCVTYIAGRADLLAAAFTLASLLFYIRYGTAGKKVFLLCSALCYVCALYSKEVALLLVPLLLVVYNAAFRPGALFRLGSYLAHAACLLLYLPFRFAVLRGLTLPNLELARLGLFPRVFTSLKTLFIDLRLLLVPYDLHYGRTTDVEYSLFGSPQAILTILGLLCVAAFLVRSYRRWVRVGDQMGGVVFFGTSWFLASMVPLLNIVPLQVFLSENWLYLPSCGIYLVIAWALEAVRRFLFVRRAAFGNLFAVLVFVGILGYGLVTRERNKDYRDEIRFYQSTVRWRPNVKFYTVLGGLFGQKGDYGTALKYLEKAIETNATYPSSDVAGAYFNLGITYVNLSRFKEAEAAFEKVMASDHEELKRQAEQNLLAIRSRR